MERGAVDRVDANRQSHDQCTRHQSARGTQSTEGAQKGRTVSFGHLKGALTRATMSPRRSTDFRPPTLNQLKTLMTLNLQQFKDVSPMAA